MKILWAFVCALVLGAGLQLAAQQPESMQTALASVVRQLGACQSQVGPLLGLQADVISGKYVDWPTVKQQIETANPTLELDVLTHKISAKPPKP